MHGLGLEKELSVFTCCLMLLNHHPPCTPGQDLTTSYFHPSKRVPVKAGMQEPGMEPGTVWKGSSQQFFFAILCLDPDTSSLPPAPPDTNCPLLASCTARYLLHLQKYFMIRYPVPMLASTASHLHLQLILQCCQVKKSRKKKCLLYCQFF